ncbi:MAG: tetratricopeptide repeat protein [Candidatus Omnitrophica bacterium]|nr:tetratricopeptide repeat protein [Candidatus Omnitrophota bacterium]
MKISIILFIIISLGVLAYSNSLGNSFVWDDSGFIIKNDFIKDPKLISSYFTSKEALAKGSLAGENYRPFLTLSYAIDYFFWRLNPLGYHISNLFFHILCAILLFFIVLILTKDRIVSLFTALFFVTHPIQTEAVTWISGRADVLFLFFYLSSLLLYINFVTRGRPGLYFLSLIAFACSLFSKEMAASLPFIIILYDIFYGKKEKISARAVRYFSFFLILESYIILRLHIIGKLAQTGYWTGDVYTTFLSMARGVVFYIKLLLYPVNLCADYLKFPLSDSIKEPGVIFSIAVIGMLLGVALKLSRKHKHISFSILWFFITLGPVINIIPINILIAERFLYLPSIGYCLLIAVLIAGAADKMKKIKGLIYLPLAFAVFLVGAYSYLTMMRNEDWADDVTLWEQTVQVCPNNERAHHNLAASYIIKGTDIEEAHKQALKALEIEPGYSRSRLVVATYLINKNKPPDAIAEIKRAIKDDPYFVEAYAFLGNIYTFLGEYEKAYNEYKKALILKPDFLEASINVATLYLIKGDMGSGIEEFNKILKRPRVRHHKSIYAAVYLRLGDAYFTAGDEKSAMRAWRKVHEDFATEIWFHEISKFLIGEITLEGLLRESDSWQPEFKAICYYYVGLKKEMQRDFEGAKIYYEQSKNLITKTFQQVRVLAERRLLALEEK